MDFTKFICVMEDFFTNEDWVLFKRLYLNELYLFSTEGIVQKQNSSSRAYSHVYKIANESAKKSNYRMTLRLNKEGSHLSNIAKSDVDNGIDEFDNFIRYASSPQNVLKGEEGDTGTEEERDTGIEVILSLVKQLNNLNNSPVRPDTVLAALGRSETIVLNIIEKYFGLDPQELLTAAEKEKVKDAGKYGVIACLFNKILRLYYLLEHLLNPLSVLKDCRNTTHPKPGELYSTYKISSGEPSNELAKFIVFTFIWIIIICRKTIVSLIYSEIAFLPAVINKKEKETEVAFERRKQSEEDQNKSRVETLKKVLLNEALEYKSFKPGMNLHVKVIGAKPQSIEWTLKDDKVDRKINETKMLEAPDCKDVTIPGVFRYDDITIKVTTSDQGSKEFNCTIPNPCTVAKESIITLHYPYQQYKVEITVDDGNQITEEETAKLPVPDDTVTLDITSDLECSMTIPGVVQNCTVARNGNVTLRIPKGRHEITLTAKDNPSYVMTREVDLTCDTAVKDMLFAKEVRNHSEWWKTALQNIVVLKKTFCDGDNKFVLWDKTVDLPVYFCKCYNENGFGKCETGFSGNLFYVKEETGCYRYYDLTNNNDNILSGHLFTFAEKRRQCCEFTGYRGKGDALVIDKDGKELYRIFESKDWNESLIGLYEDFINKFEFSDGWAAMLKPDGTIVFINEDWMEDNESTYPFDSAYYPVFHDGWCAVKNGDGDYLFLRDMTSCIKTDNNKYDLLQPVIVKDNWACISKTKNLYQIINPNSGEYLLSEAFQFIESSHGLFKIKLEDRWAILDSNLKDWVFPDTRLNDKVRFSTGEYHIITKDFFIQKGLNESDGDKFVYICVPNKLLGADFKGFSLIYDSVHPSSANFIAVKKHDKKWFVFDAKGNEHLTGYDDFIYYKEGIFVIEKDGVHECWKAVGDKLFNICKAEWAFIDKDELFIYNTSVLPHIKDKKKDFAKLRQFKVTPTENSWNLLQIHDWNIEKSVHTINPFLSYAKDVHNVKEMEDSIAKISSGHEIDDFYRHGNLWIADDDEKKMIFSNSWKLLMDECDEITSVSDNLYYVTNNDNAYFIDDTGKRTISIFYRKIRPITNGFAAVYATAWGFVQINDGSIKEICVRKYSEVKDFSKEGYAMVYKENEGWGLIDGKGTLVVECKYDEVDDFKIECDYTSARINDSWMIISKDGIEV